MDAAVSSTARAVPYSRIRELAELAMRMEGVAKLYFGESSLPTPEFIQEAARRAMADGYLTYTPNAGLLSTREAIAGYYARMHGVALDPAREVVVTGSGVQALNVAIRATLDPGEEALVLTPAWPNASSIIRKDQGVAIEIAQPLEGDRYGIDWERLEAAVTARTRLLVYTSPSNPLGWTATREDQERLLAFTRRHGLWLLADEVYERLVYEGPNPAPSILRLAGREDAVIVVQSFSKSYCMTGWRLGWIVARADLARQAAELNEFTISCPPGFVQRAGETALAEGEAFIAGLLGMLRENREMCAAALREMPGWTVPRPDGAFYLFPRVGGLTDSFALCRRLLTEARVGLAPGVGFGAGGEGSLRICYAVEKPILAEALQRLRRFPA